MVYFFPEYKGKKGQRYNKGRKTECKLLKGDSRNFFLLYPLSLALLLSGSETPSAFAFCPCHVPASLQATHKRALSKLPYQQRPH